MERVTNHERPGVYSAYTATAAAQRGNRRGVAAVVAVSQKGTAGTLYALGSYRQAAETFGAEDGLTALVKLLLANGAARVLAVPVANENGYEAAFALVQEQEGVNVVVCDSEKLAVQQKLRDSVMSASAERRERIAVVAGAAGETAEALVKRAGELNSERVVLVAPAVSQEAGGAWVAAAVAGAICGGSDPALPLGGAELQGISALEKRLDESEVDALIRGGVTPVERVGGSCWVIRGVTTRTKTGQASDRTWRDLTTILVVDDVIPGVREALRARFPRAKNTAQTRGAVQSLVVEVLERKLASVFYQEGPGMLIHPVWQSANVYFVGLALAQEPKQDYVRYTFTFWEDENRYRQKLVPVGQKKTTGAVSKPAAPSSTGNGGAAAGTEYHTVTQGETLWGIAQSRGMSLGELLVLNPQLKNPNRISAGQRLRVK